MFSYCLNDPINYTDPGGLCALCLVSKNSNQFSMTGFYGCGGESIGGYYTRKATSRDKKNGLIHDQARFPYSEEAVGLGSYADSGCAIIATYNALQLLGKTVSLGSIRDEYLFKHGTILLGLGGVGPWSFDDYFESHGINCAGYLSFDSLHANISEGGVVIFTLMNDVSNITKGFHTMAAQYVNGKYHVYNGYSSGVQVVSNLRDVNSGNMWIWGYIVGG